MHVSVLLVYGEVLSKVLVVVVAVAILGLVWWRRGPRAETLARAELTTRRARSSSRRPGWRWVVAAAVLSYGGLYAAGALASYSMDHADRRHDPDGALDVLSLPSLGAVLPGARASALWLVHARLEHDPRTLENIEMKLEVAHMLGCQIEARELLDEARFERAYPVAMSCDEPHIAFMSLLYLGRIDEAARMLTADGGAGLATLSNWVANPLRLAGDTMIAVGRWSDAAQIADMRANDTATGPQPPAVVELVNRDRCLAELFRAYGGDPHAVDRIRARAREAHAAACAEIAALAAGQDDTWLARTLAADPPSHDGKSSWRAFEHGTTTVWLAPFANRGESSGANLEWLAIYHAYLGDVAGVRQDAAALRALAPDANFALALQVSLGVPVDETHALADVSRLEGAVLQPAWELYGHNPGNLSMKDLAQIGTVHHLFRPNCLDDLSRAYWSAMTGDGELVTHMIQHCAQLARARSILAVLPYVVEHRDVLRDAFRTVPVGEFSPLDVEIIHTQLPNVIAQLVKHRDLMRVSGNADLAAHWQASIDRYAAALHDRNRAIALQLW